MVETATGVPGEDSARGARWPEKSPPKRFKALRLSLNGGFDPPFGLSGMVDSAVGRPTTLFFQPIFIISMGLSVAMDDLRWAINELTDSGGVFSFDFSGDAGFSDSLASHAEVVVSMVEIASRRVVFAKSKTIAMSGCKNTRKC
jgi:hypothetical protein